MSFKCCGNDKYSDWFNIRWGRRYEGFVLKSCCRDFFDEFCNKYVIKDVIKIYIKGCYNFV